MCNKNSQKDKPVKRCPVVQFLKYIIIIVTSVIFIYFVISFIIPNWLFPSSITTNKKNHVYDYFHEISFIYYLLATSFSALLAWIAYSNFNKINMEMKAKFLLDIDKKWGEPAILEAREIIHGIILSCNDAHKTPEEKNNICGEKIANLFEEKNTEEIKKYIKVLNFLDFMETTGYLYTSGYVDFNDVKEMCGPDITLSYQLLEPLINKLKDKSISYENFKKLYDALEESKSKI